jgi:hypothetical protein
MARRSHRCAQPGPLQSSLSDRSDQAREHLSVICGLQSGQGFPFDDLLVIGGDVRYPCNAGFARGEVIAHQALSGFGPAYQTFAE